MKHFLWILFSGTIVFWNVENFFNPQAQSENPSEMDFTAKGSRHWTHKRQKEKASRICKVILSMADSTLQPPSLVALAEVEDKQCLKALVYGTSLRKFGYHYIHYDSHDPRGIDCALLYRGAKPKCSRPIPLKDSLGKIIPSRDLLLVEFDSISVMVCHLPSKRGGSREAETRRKTALSTIKEVCDSLCGTAMIVIGDFNDTRAPLSDSLLGPRLREVDGLLWRNRKGQVDGKSGRREMESEWHGEEEISGENWQKGERSKDEWRVGGMIETRHGKYGSIKFEGCWEQIDRALVSEGVKAKMWIVQTPSLLTEDKKYGGVKPLRTYSGPRYLGGVSDHLPIILEFRSAK